MNRRAKLPVLPDSLECMSMERPVKRCVISRAHTAGLQCFWENTLGYGEWLEKHCKLNMPHIQYNMFEFWVFTSRQSLWNGKKWTTFLFFQKPSLVFFLVSMKSPEVHEVQTQRSFKTSASILMGTCHHSTQACQECKERLKRADTR